MSEGFLLRVKYEKRDRLAYLSHLETVRSMERVVRRAQLPYAVTAGFNPHMKVAFGPALPVGAGGLGEYLDVLLREYVPAAFALERMRAVSAPGLRCIACEYVDPRSDAITVAYPVSVWEAVFSGSDSRGPDMLRGELERAFACLFEQGFIEVLRKRKKPKRVEFEGRLVEAPALEVLGGTVHLTFSTRDTGQGALRPDKFIAAALDGMTTPPRLLALTRTELREEPAG